VICGCQSTTPPVSVPSTLSSASLLTDTVPCASQRPTESGEQNARYASFTHFLTEPFRDQTMSLVGKKVPIALKFSLPETFAPSVVSIHVGVA